MQKKQKENRRTKINAERKVNRHMAFSIRCLKLMLLQHEFYKNPKTINHIKIPPKGEGKKSPTKRFIFTQNSKSNQKFNFFPNKYIEPKQ